MYSFWRQIGLICPLILIARAPQGRHGVSFTLVKDLRRVYMWNQHPLWRALHNLILIGHMIMAIYQKEASPVSAGIQATEAIFFFAYLLDMVCRFYWGSRTLFGIGKYIECTQFFSEPHCFATDSLAVCVLAVIAAATTEAYRVPVLLEAPDTAGSGTTVKVVDTEFLEKEVQSAVREDVSATASSFTLNADFL